MPAALAAKGDPSGPSDLFHAATAPGEEPAGPGPAGESSATPPGEDTHTAPEPGVVVVPVPVAPGSLPVTVPPSDVPVEPPTTVPVDEPGREGVSPEAVETLTVGLPSLVVVPFVDVLTVVVGTLVLLVVPEEDVLTVVVGTLVLLVVPEEDVLTVVVGTLVLLVVPEEDVPTVVVGVLSSVELLTLVVGALTVVVLLSVVAGAVAFVELESVVVLAFVVVLGSDAALSVVDASTGPVAVEAVTVGVGDVVAETLVPGSGVALTDVVVRAAGAVAEATVNASTQPTARPGRNLESSVAPIRLIVTRPPQTSLTRAALPTKPGAKRRNYTGRVATVAEPVLSDPQLRLLEQIGEVVTAPEGTTLYQVGDATYPFIVLLEGEVSVRDPDGNEIARHGPGKFLGEINLLSGQTVYLTAIALTPLRYISMSRERLRDLLYEDGTISELVLSTFMSRRERLQGQANVGLEIVGPRASEPTRRIVDFARRYRLPFTWHESDDHLAAGAGDGGGHTARFPIVRLPGGQELVEPTSGEISRALGIGAELAPREDVDLLIVGAGPGGLGAAVYGASEGLSTLLVDSTSIGGQAGTSRRIENYLGFPAGISGAELTTRAITQARKFGARVATPYRATSLETGADRHLVTLEGGHEVSATAVVLATGAEYRRLPVPDLERYEGISVFYEAGPPEGRLCGASRVGVVGGGNSAAQAAVWLARGGALVTLIHRREDLRETMSDYLIRELERFRVAVLPRAEVSALHGSDGELSAVTLSDGSRMNLSFLFLFLGASPCTEWLHGAVERDENGFLLTGDRVGADRVLETSVPGIYAVGDVRAGSIKRCATAVGEGGMVVRYVHERLTGVPA